MKLLGSCHCRSVHFEVESYTPCPFMYCYCSACRKTAGGGGYVINIMAQADTLKVKGREHMSIYHARMETETSGVFTTSSGERHFCTRCASFLWGYDAQWPQWVYPFASAIDTPLPKPPEKVHLMLDFAANWCEVPKGEHDKHFPRYPVESIEDWHKRNGLYNLEDYGL
jgi:hypothetical protein